jgi:hypothetical protein
VGWRGSEDGAMWMASCTNHELNPVAFVRIKSTPKKRKKDKKKIKDKKEDKNKAKQVDQNKLSKSRSTATQSS